MNHSKERTLPTSWSRRRDETRDSLLSCSGNLKSAPVDWENYSESRLDGGRQSANKVILLQTIGLSSWRSCSNKESPSFLSPSSMGPSADSLWSSSNSWDTSEGESSSASSRISSCWAARVERARWTLSAPINSASSLKLFFVILLAWDKLLVTGYDYSWANNFASWSSGL